MYKRNEAQIQRYRLPPHGGSGLKYLKTLTLVLRKLSPSTRREWIEIKCYGIDEDKCKVSLHTEGVD